MVDDIINVKILLSNGQNWVLTKWFIHSLQRKHNLFIINIKDTQDHSFAHKLYSSLESNKDLKVESFSIKREDIEDKFYDFNTIKVEDKGDKYTIQLIKDI